MASRAARSILTVADYLGAMSVWRYVREQLLHPAEIVYYHRVESNRHNSDVPVFPAGISVKRFEEHIAYLARTYEVVPLELLVECMRERKAWPRRALAITFDDGYRDNYEYAYPVLKRHRVPATIFLVAGCIENQQMFWWDQVHFTVLHHSRWPDPLELPPDIYPSELRECWKSYIPLSTAERVCVARDIVERLKAVPDAVRLAVMGDLPARLGVEIGDGKADASVLSWAEIREMMVSGISFGAHTLTHPSLDQVDPSKLWQEVKGSKTLIEQRIQRSVRLFAYPAGSGVSRAEVLDALKAAGFWGALTNRPYVNTLRTDPLLIGRRWAPDEPAAVLAAVLLGWFDIWSAVKSGLPIRDLQKTNK